MKECKFCKSTKVKIKRTISSNYYDIKFSLFKCSICHSFFFDIKEHIIDLNELYNNSEINLDLYQKFKPSRYWSYEAYKILKLYPKLNSILDIGCKTGDFLLHFPKKIRKVGVELSLQSASIAEKRGLEIYKSFVEELDFGDEKFDVITCFAVLEHIENPISVIKKLFNIIKPNGLFVIMIPIIESFKAQLLYFFHYRWHMFNPPEHLNFFSRTFLDNFMGENHFKCSKRVYTSGSMFNPLRSIPYFNRIFSRFMFMIDSYTPINELPLFDHMYSYYIKY